MSHRTSLLWAEETLHHMWPVLLFQKMFYHISRSYGFNGGFAFHCCQPNLWSDWILNIWVPYYSP